MEAAMEDNGNSPVTRADLQEFKRELLKELGEFMDVRFRQVDERFHQLDEDFSQRMQKSDDRFTERLRDMETRLLKGFYDYQQHSDVRMRKMSADLSNMDTASELRLNNLERRLSELERKILEGGH